MQLEKFILSFQEKNPEFEIYSEGTVFGQIFCALVFLPSILKWEFSPQYTAVKLGWQWEF